MGASLTSLKITLDTGAIDLGQLVRCRIAIDVAPAIPFARLHAIARLARHVAVAIGKDIIVQAARGATLLRRALSGAGVGIAASNLRPGIGIRLAELGSPWIVCEACSISSYGSRG